MDSLPHPIATTTGGGGERKLHNFHNLHKFSKKISQKKLMSQ